MRRDWLKCSPDKYITIRDLYQVGVISKPRFGVVLLGKGFNSLTNFE